MKPYDTELSKKEEVRAMFDNIAPAYDRLNHTLSLSVDRIWRRRVVRIVGRLHPRRVLDMATGTGDLAVMMARSIPEAHIKGVDLSEGMLDVARRKVAARGLEERVTLEAGDAETAVAAAGSVDVDRHSGVFDAHDAGFRTALRLVFASGAAPYRGLAVARPAGLRLPAPFGGRISAAGGVPDDSRRSGVPQLPCPEPEFRHRTDLYRREVLKRLHILCLALLAAATLGGCHRYLAREVRIVPKDVETYGSAGADVTLHVANRGSRPLRFEAAALSLAYDGGEVLRATLRDTVTVASGWEGDVRMRCRLRVPDRAALYAVQRKLQRAETQRMTVSFALRLRVGDAVKKIGRRRMPLSDFLNTFGLRPEDLLTDSE